MDGVNELEMLEEQEEEKRHARMRLEAGRPRAAHEDGAARPKAHVRLHRLEWEWARATKRLHRARRDGHN